jgi:hypothetical protein
MDLWIVQHRVWRLGSWGQVAQRFVILPEESVDHPDELASNPPEHLSAANVGLRPFIIGAHARYQALVEFRPLAVVLLVN